MRVTKVSSNMKPVKASRPTVSRVSRKVYAADDDFDMDGYDGDGIMDAIDDVADNVEELQDAVDDVKEDSVDIAINNNISDHYIAECDNCQKIFISSVVQSDQALDHVSGVCPLCGKESDQYLKWVIKDAKNA